MVCLWLPSSRKRGVDSRGLKLEARRTFQPQPAHLSKGVPHCLKINISHQRLCSSSFPKPDYIPSGLLCLSPGKVSLQSTVASFLSVRLCLPYRSLSVKQDTPGTHSVVLSSNILLDSFNS